MKDLAKAIGVVGIAGVVGFYLMITNFSYKAGVIFLGYDAAVGVLLVMWAILANAEPLNKNVPGAC